MTVCGTQNGLVLAQFLHPSSISCCILSLRRYSAPRLGLAPRPSTAVQRKLRQGHASPGEKLYALRANGERQNRLCFLTRQIPCEIISHLQLVCFSGLAGQKGLSSADFITVEGTGQLPAGRQAPGRHLWRCPATYSTRVRTCPRHPGEEAPGVLTRPAQDLLVPLIELTRRLVCRLLQCVFPSRHLSPKKTCFWVSFSAQRI